MGRPTKFTKKLAEEICVKLAEGRSLRSICREESKPDISTVLRWYLSEADTYRGFREQYARAREAQRHVRCDELVDIADEAFETRDSLKKAEIRISVRQWELGQMASKRPKEEAGSEPPPDDPLIVFKRGPTRKSKGGTEGGDAPAE